MDLVEMKEEKIIKKEKIIEQKLLDYFKKRKLKVLNNEKGKEYFTGVTFFYIETHVIESYLDRKLLAAILCKLCIEKKIQCLYCDNVHNIVFESKKSNHWSFEMERIILENNISSYEKKYYEDIDNYPFSYIVFKLMKDNYLKYKDKFQSVEETTTPVTEEVTSNNIENTSN